MMISRFNRDEMVSRLRDESFDVLVVGGGATGLGVAVDAASRHERHHVEHGERGHPT